MKKILLFASGNGSNVQAILNYFEKNDDVVFPILITNNPHAGVIQITGSRGLDVMVIDKEMFYQEMFIDTIDFYKPDLIVLAGFLWKIPSFIIQGYKHKIINIHPALLPLYGGKGMYGHHVHEAVLDNGDKESGITIHMVNEQYDDGTILLQKKVKITKTDTVKSLAEKVLKLEHEWYPKVIESLILKN